MFNFFGKKKQSVKNEEVSAEKVEIKESEKKLSSKEILQAEKIYKKGLATIKDAISPGGIEIAFDHLKLNDFYLKSFFVYSYPRFINEDWLSPIINMNKTIDISIFIYPYKSGDILKMLRKKTAQMRSTMNLFSQKGMSRDVSIQASLEDAEELRDSLQRGQEKFFQFGLYFTLYDKTLSELNKSSIELETKLGTKLVLTKRANLQMGRCFTSTQPLCLDQIEITRNMNTSPLSSSFPFSSSSLTSDKGIMYGVNRHNSSLIIFDRFSLSNANSVVLATSGAGKSYTVKLEMFRQMITGTDILIIDPENEYKDLCDTVGGTFISLSINSKEKINPFDIPKGIKDREASAGDLLRSAIINVSGIISLMVGKIGADEESILDKGIIEAYKRKGINFETENPGEMEVPIMEDLYNVLNENEISKNLALKLEKYVKGSFSGFFNKRTNIDLKASKMIVFNVRDLEEQFRPIAMHMILNFIWNEVRSSLKKRCLVVDEAWKIMQYEESAKFLFGLVKRARKYYLGVTTITQDVDDFLGSKYGKPIVTNSSMQILLKQSPSSAEVLQKTFRLTDGEKNLLVNSGVGQGIFFAENNHAAIEILASSEEDKIITTNPEQISNQKK